jgi:hypothetical protein
MRITPRQAVRINEIIQEEVQTALEKRREPSFKEMVSGFDTDTQLVIQERLSQLVFEEATSAVENFQKKAYAIIAEETYRKSDGLNRITPRTLKESLEYVDDLEDLRANITVEISSRLNDLSDGIYEAVASVIDHNDSEEL